MCSATPSGCFDFLNSVFSSKEDAIYQTKKQFKQNWKLKMQFNLNFITELQNQSKKDSLYFFLSQQIEKN